MGGRYADHPCNLADWMEDYPFLKELIVAVLLDSSALQRGYFNPQGVRQLLNEHFLGQRDHSPRIWRLLMFELWHRNFLSQFRSVGSASTLDAVVSLYGDKG